MQSQPVRPTAALSTAKAVAGSSSLFLAMTMLMFGHGLQETLLGIRAIREGFGPLVTGAVMACYYLGFILSSLRTPALIQRVGHVRCYAAFSAAASVAVLVHGLVVEPVVWGAMRLVTGFCLAGIYIVCESWLNGTSENSGRGGLIAIYTMVLLLSVSAGQMAVSLGDPSSIFLFILASAMISLALLPMVLSVQPSPELDTSERFGFRELATASPLGVVLAVGAGLIYGAYGGMGAAYGTHIGLSAAEVGVFMMVITISGGIAQWVLGSSVRVPARAA